MSDISLPGRRRDITTALGVLVDLRPGSTDWPGLTEAVHWLIDDTWWDEHGPHGDVGTLLRDGREAKAITATLTPLLAVLDDLGPAANDDDYLAHPRWRDVVTAAGNAYRLLITT